MKPIATVVDNNQPGWRNIVETEPNVTLSIGTKLYLSTAVPEGLPTLGSPFCGGFYAGEYILDGILYSLVVASKTDGEKLDIQYKTQKLGTPDGTSNDDDGVVNSDRINDADHPAAQFCRSLLIGGYDDWYLPSRDELAMLCRNLGPKRDKTPEPFKSGGSEAFEERWYWSSTEYASNSFTAWVVGFYVGSQYLSH